MKDNKKSKSIKSKIKSIFFNIKITIRKVACSLKSTILNIVKTIKSKLKTNETTVLGVEKKILEKNITKDEFSNKINTDNAASIVELDENGKLKPSISDFTGNSNEIFATNKQKYENTMSSAIILFVFGIGGLFIEFLAVIGLIYLPLLKFQYILMFLVFLFFFLSGYFSYKKANTYKEGMTKEDQQREHVDYFLNDLLTDQVLKELKSDDLTEEENYVCIVEKLRDMILEKYPDYNKDLLEYMIDDYLNEHF